MVYIFIYCNNLPIFLFTGFYMFTLICIVDWFKLLTLLIPAPQGKQFFNWGGYPVKMHCNSVFGYIDK